MDRPNSKPTATDESADGYPSEREERQQVPSSSANEGTLASPPRGHVGTETQASASTAELDVFIDELLQDTLSHREQAEPVPSHSFNEGTFTYILVQIPLQENTTTVTYEVTIDSNAFSGEPPQGSLSTQEQRELVPSSSVTEDAFADPPRSLEGTEAVASTSTAQGGIAQLNTENFNSGQFEVHQFPPQLVFIQPEENFAIDIDEDASFISIFQFDRQSPDRTE